MPTQEKKKILKGQNMSATPLRWFASDTAHIVIIIMSSMVKPVHIFMASNFLRRKRFEKHICEMKSWFSQKGYPQKLIETKTSKVKFSDQRVFDRRKVEKVVPLVVIYHSLLKSIEKIIYDNLYLLYVNKKLKHLFTPGPVVSFRSSRKISSYLVKAKLYPVERSVGSFNCKRPRCQICVC